MAEFEKLQVARWTPHRRQDLEVRFAVTEIGESGGNRLVPHERPYRDGAKYDDLGSQPKTWQLMCVFNNTIEEPGLEGNPAASYPTMMNRLIESFDVHETGDLVVPTRGRVRARAQSYTRREKADERDTGYLDLTFVLDNEDSIDAASFTAPTANASVRRRAEITTFDAQSDGAWHSSLADLNEFASELEALANGPGDLVADIDDQAGIVVGAANRALLAFSDPSREGRDILTDPESSKTQRNLLLTKDIAARSAAEARAGRPTVVSVVFAEPRTLFAIAASVGQTFDDLLIINPRLEDPLLIPAGVLVNILSS